MLVDGFQIVSRNTFVQLACAFAITEEGHALFYLPIPGECGAHRTVSGKWKDMWTESCDKPLHLPHTQKSISVKINYFFSKPLNFGVVITALS